MTEIKARIATTHPMEQAGVKIAVTKEALESAAKQANGERAIPMTVEHNPFCLPFGKTVEAWVEPYGNEHALVALNYIEDNPQQKIHIKTGTELVYLAFEDAPKPFLRKTANSDESQIEMVVDITIFDSQEESDEFFRDLKTIDSEISLRHSGRFSLGPEPLVQFVLSDPAVTIILSSIALWAARRIEKFVSYAIDETLRKVADDISDSWSSKLKSLLGIYKIRQSKDDRPIVSQIIIPTDNMHVILLVKIDRDEEHPRINLRKLIVEMEKYADLLQDAEEVTFARVGIDDWQFLYLKTQSGQVIGTAECYEKTLQECQGNRGFSIHIGKTDKENLSE